jgi:RNA polymerase sigma-70 factor (ECF subfamily)
MWPETDKTQELLEQARLGKETAVNDLMERHRSALIHLVRMRLDRKLQQRVDVSDVVQDVLIEASRRLGTYLENPQMMFHLWLRHIAKDRIIDAHRRHRVSAKRSVDREQSMSVPAGYDHSSIQLAAQIIDKELTPAARATQDELARRVEQVIQQLDEKDAEIVVMRHYEQLTNQEAAAVLELSEAAASMRYLRAIRRLKSLLTGADGNSDDQD